MPLTTQNLRDEETRLLKVIDFAEEELEFIHSLLRVRQEVVHYSYIPRSEKKVSNSKNKDKNPSAVALGRLGGLKGGPARAKKLTKKQRSEAARKAALARWKKKITPKLLNNIKITKEVDGE